MSYLSLVSCCACSIVPDEWVQARRESFGDAGQEALQVYSTYHVEKHHARFMTDRRMDYPHCHGLAAPIMLAMYGDVAVAVSQEAMWEAIDKEISEAADGHVEVPLLFTVWPLLDVLAPGALERVTNTAEVSFKNADSWVYTPHSWAWVYTDDDDNTFGCWQPASRAVSVRPIFMVVFICCFR